MCSVVASLETVITLYICLLTELFPSYTFKTSATKKKGELWWLLLFVFFFVSILLILDGGIKGIRIILPSSRSSLSFLSLLWINSSLSLNLLSPLLNSSDMLRAEKQSVSLESYLKWHVNKYFYFNQHRGTSFG